MREFEATDRMPAAKEVVFDELSRAGFLERWMPAGVRPRQVTGPADGGPVAADGTIRVLPERCRSEWSGRAGGGDYAGFVEVRDSGAGASEVTVHVAMAEGVPEPRPAPEVAAELAESLRDLYLAVSKRVTSP